MMTSGNRNAETLLGISDTATLLQYLYGDEAHFVDVENAIGVPLRLTINDHGYLLCQNLNFPDIPPHSFEDGMAIPNLLAVVDQLRGQPASTSAFPNRWEEIRSAANVQLSMSRRP